MTVIPVRESNAYTGFSIQGSQGVAAAPTFFPRWEDGTSIEVDQKLEDVWEGDGSRHINLIVKNGMQIKFKLHFRPRPNELGFFEGAGAGALSDAYAAPAVSTTLSGATVVGATSVSVVGNTGLTGSTAISLVLSAGTVREEIATFLPPTTGAGPYVLNVAATYNGGQLKNAHSSADTVQSAPTHVFTDQSDGNYYSAEYNFGGSTGITIRFRDCKVEQIKRSGKAGGLLEYEVDFSGIASSVQATPSTVVLDPHLPFLWTQGAWQMEGVSTGEAADVDQMDITTKNNTDWVQSELLVGDAVIFGQLHADVSIQSVWQNASSAARFRAIYYGSAAGTTEAQAVMLGSLLVTFTQPDGFNSVSYSVPTQVYTKAPLPAPKASSAKAARFPLQASGISNNGVNPYLLQTTVHNTTFAAQA